MAQQRAIVHIGTHKTGTTAFQRWASANAQELAAKAGVHYYRGLFRASHIEFPMLCMRENRNMPMRAQIPDWCLDEWKRDTKVHLRSQLSGAGDTLLVSAEALSLARHRDEVERLVELLAPRAVTVLVTLREPRSYLRSYRHTIEGMGFAPSRYRESFAYVEEDSWLADYDALLGAYRAVLGPDRVLTLDYEQSLEKFESIIPALMDAAGVDAEQIPSWRPFRPGPPPRRGLLSAARARRRRSP